MHDSDHNHRHVGVTSASRINLGGPDDGPRWTPTLATILKGNIDIC